MSDFHAANLHKKVDHIMDVFFGAGVASHPTIIEQINYLLFMRALSRNDDDLRKLGVTDSEQIVFDGELEKYRWDNLLTLNAEQLFVALEECFRKIPESTANKTVRLIFRNAHIKLFDKPTLRTVLHEIDAFAKLMDEGEHRGKRDIFGDTYEYLLSKLAQAGTSGQFRTPRHIIEFLVKVVAPRKGETIIDPAVGTAGFLVKAFEYLRHEYTSPEQLASGGAFDKLSSGEHSFLYEHTFSGYDSDEDMIKFGMMNLYLHGLQNARMIRQNTLTDTAGTRDKYDVILANPPFAGKLDKDSVAEELQMNTAATEVLFLRYMLRHLTDNGRAGVIVPEGVLFNTSSAHKKIREMLLENGLWCVVSLPGGVFNPYAGVKTSILFFDKTRTENAEVLFAKVENDGFSLGAQRRPITKNDLPKVYEYIESYKRGDELQLTNAHVVSHEIIKATEDFNLIGDRYKIADTAISHDYPMVELGDILSYEQPTPYIVKSVDYDDVYKTPVLTAGKTFILGYTNEVEGIYTNTPVIIFDDFTTAIKYVDFPFKVKSSAMKILKVIDNDRADIRYIFRVMALIDFTPREHKRFWISQYSKFKIPLPPLHIQKKIAGEIESKQEAIDHARGLIVSLGRERSNFNPSARAAREGWQSVTLEEVVDELFAGGDVPKDSMSKEKDALHTVPIYSNGIGDKALYGFTDKVRVQRDAVTVSARGTIGYPEVRKAPFFPIVRLIVAVPNAARVTPEYLRLALQSTKITSSGNTIQQLTVPSIKGISFPLPPLEIQDQIVAEMKELDKWIEAAHNTIDFMEKAISSRLAEI